MNKINLLLPVILSFCSTVLPMFQEGNGNTQNNAGKIQFHIVDAEAIQQRELKKRRRHGTFKDCLNPLTPNLTKPENIKRGRPRNFKESLKPLKLHLTRPEDIETGQANVANRTKRRGHPGKGIEAVPSSIEILAPERKRIRQQTQGLLERNNEDIPVNNLNQHDIYSYQTYRELAIESSLQLAAAMTQAGQSVQIVPAMAAFANSSQQALEQNKKNDPKKSVDPKLRIKNLLN